MGASGWDYRVPYPGSIEAALIAVQEQILASGDYIWPWDDDEHGVTDAGYAELFEVEERQDVPRPSSLADLNAAKEIEEFWEEGTHTILDIDRVITAASDEVGAIRPLSPEELSRAFGTVQPSAAEFDRVYQLGEAGPFGVLCGERWTGRSTVIYKDGTPAEVYFWGSSGD